MKTNQMTYTLKLLLDLDELSNSIVHLLDSLVLGETKTSLVGDVVDATLSFSVLTTSSTDLNRTTKKKKKPPLVR